MPSANRPTDPTDSTTEDTMDVPRTNDDEPTTADDATQELITDAPVTDEPVMDEPVTDTILTDAPADEPSTSPVFAAATSEARPIGATTLGAAAPELGTPRGVRVGTVVWGLVIAAVGVGLVAAASGVQFDTELAFIALIAAAGLALLVGSLATATRRRRG
jgi:hypothetical protein